MIVGRESTGRLVGVVVAGIVVGGRVGEQLLVVARPVAVELQHTGRKKIVTYLRLVLCPRRAVLNREVMAARGNLQRGGDDLRAGG